MSGQEVGGDLHVGRDLLEDGRSEVAASARASRSAAGCGSGRAGRGASGAAGSTRAASSTADSVDGQIVAVQFAAHLLGSFLEGIFRFEGDGVAVDFAVGHFAPVGG